MCAMVALFTVITRGKRRDHDDTLLALAMAWMWASAMCVDLFIRDMPRMDARTIGAEAGAMIDLAAGMFIASRLRRPWPIWKINVAVLNGMSILTHAAFLTSDKTREMSNMHKLALNIIFTAILACICSPGATNAFRRYRFRVLHSLRTLGRSGGGVAR